MVEFTYVITDEQGLHAWPATQFVMAAAKCKSTVSVTFGSRTVNAKGVMAVMSLGAKKVDLVRIINRLVKNTV